MGRRKGRLVGVALVMWALAGVAGCVAGDQRRTQPAQLPTTAQPVSPTPTPTTVTTGEDYVARASRVRVFFGHMSVGENILGGVAALTVGRTAGAPDVVSFPVDGPLPEVPRTGAIVHTAIGDNGDPLGKLANFDRLLRSGLADRVDVAVLKFCYIDIDADTDVERLARSYRTTLDALEHDYPHVTFLHSTAPLMAAPTGLKGTVKSWLGKDDNVARERYSARIRDAYPADRLFDIAAIEGTAPDGNRQPALHPGYTTDGGHLNEAGSAVVAEAFLRLIAAQAQD